MTLGTTDRLRALIEYVAKGLADRPEAVWVEKRERGSTVIYYLHVASVDVGRVVGKEGRTAAAIRALLRAAATGSGTQVILEID